MPQIIGLAGCSGDFDEKEVLDDMVRISGESTVRQIYRDQGIIMVLVSDIAWPQGELQVESPDGRFVGLFLGELYNTEDELRFFEAKGFKFRSKSDAEIALAAFIYRDDGGLSILNGEFRCVVHDQKTGSIHFILDRYGFRRFYHTQVGGCLAFAGKIRCFLKLPGFQPEANLKGIAALMQFGFILGEGALLEGTYFFPPATVSTFDEGKLRKLRYWDYPHTLEKDELLTEEQAVEEMAYLLRKAMRKMHKGGYRTGIQLTGGLDSRALITAAEPEIRDFTVLTMGIPGCYDIRIASKIAKKYGLPHKIIELDWYETSRYAVEAMWESEGEVVSFMADSYLLGLEAKDVVDLTYNGIVNILSGRFAKSGDLQVNTEEDFLERVRNIPFFHQNVERMKAILPDKFSLWSEWNREQVLETVRFSGDTVNDILLFMMHYFCRHSVVGLKISQDCAYVRLPFLENDFLETYFAKVPPELKIGEGLYRRVILKNGPEVADVPAGSLNIPINAPAHIRLFAETKETIITKLNNLKNIIIKSKMPYVPHMQYIDYAAQLIIDKNLQDIMKDLLFSDRTQRRGIFNQAGLKRFWENHFNTRYSYIQELSRAASIELFHRLFMEGEHP